MTRRIDEQHLWGEDGDVVVVFGHQDRVELRAAAVAYVRAEWHGGFVPLADNLDGGVADDSENFDGWYSIELPDHIYVVESPFDTEYDAPWFFYQREPVHPDHETIPVTVVELDGGILIPDVANVARYCWRCHRRPEVDRLGPLPCDRCLPEWIVKPDPLADRLISKVVHR